MLSSHVRMTRNYAAPVTAGPLMSTSPARRHEDYEVGGGTAPERQEAVHSSATTHALELDAPRLGRPPLASGRFVKRGAALSWPACLDDGVSGLWTEAKPCGSRVILRRQDHPVQSQLRLFQ